MIRFNLKTLIADKEFLENRRITYDEISRHTGLSKPTLSKIATKKGYNVTSSNIEKLCRFLDCDFNDFMTLID